MKFYNTEEVQKAFLDFVQSLRLKGYELKPGTNNPLSPQNDRLLTSWLYKNSTNDEGITTITYEILWKWLKAAQYEVEWVEGKAPAGVAAKQGAQPKGHKGNLPDYQSNTTSIDRVAAEEKKKNLEAQWEACIRETKQCHANSRGKSTQRQEMIKDLIKSYAGQLDKAAECYADIQKLKHSWVD